MKLEPTSGIGWTSLGNSFAKLKRFTEAKDAARQAVKQAPDYGPAWALLGKLYSEENRYTDAADAFQRAAQLMPKDAEFWRSLAESYTKMNEPAKSQEAFQKSQEITGNVPVAHASPVAPEKDKYTGLVMGTLQAIERRDIDTIMSRYPEKVVYRDYGIVNRAFIRDDLGKYFARWPDTQAKLIGQVQIFDTKKADEKRLVFSYDFLARSPDRDAWSAGSTANEWWIWETQDGLRVFGEKQKVTKRQKSRSDEFAETVTRSASAPPILTHQDSRPVYVVVAPASRGLHIRSEANAGSAIIATLHQGDRVFVEQGRVRNNRPPSPVEWQKVTNMNGDTGWINADYLTPGR